MQQLMSESVQASVRPHECEDNYYADKHSSKIQCFASIVENRFVVALSSLNGNSTSTVTLNPDGLLTDVVLTVIMSAPSVPNAPDAAGAGLALTRGWLYQLVDRINTGPCAV